jgi:hypothetical protein
MGENVDNENDRKSCFLTKKNLFDKMPIIQKQINHNEQKPILKFSR